MLSGEKYQNIYRKLSKSSSDIVHSARWFPQYTAHPSYLLSQLSDKRTMVTSFQKGHLIYLFLRKHSHSPLKLFYSPFLLCPVAQPDVRPVVPLVSDESHVGYFTQKCFQAPTSSNTFVGAQKSSWSSGSAALQLRGSEAPRQSDGISPRS